MVRKNLEGYTKKQVEGAIEAHCLQVMLGHPSRKDFEGMIANCPVTSENTTHAHQLYGENLAGLRGETVQKKPEQVVTDYVQILRDLVQMNKYVTLTADVIFVNNLAFVIAYGQGMGLILNFVKGSM